MASTMIDFIETGELGPILLGTTLDSIQKFLGSPQDISISKKPLILKYGALQLVFDNSILTDIYLYFDDIESFPKKLGLEGWIPNGNTTQQELIELLSSQGVTITLDNQHTFENIQKGYISKSGVIVIFDNKDKLVKILLSKKDY